MVRKVHQFNYDVEQLDDILRRADEQPFVIWHDEKAGVYRFFPDEARRDIWIEAYQNDALTPEINKYQFANPITAPAPNSITITLLSEDNKPVLYGEKNVTLDFTFETNDSYGNPQPESVDVYYTFSSAAGTKTASGYYTAGTEVHMLVDDYLEVGTNNITILVRGRSTNAMKTTVVRFNVVVLELTSTFQIARPIIEGKKPEITYKVTGSYDKVVHFFIDGVQVATDSVSSLEPDVTKTKILGVVSPGKHTLQLYATMQVNNIVFKSNLLYYEFIVEGVENSVSTVVSEVFPNTQDVIQNFDVVFHAEQYVEKVINWAYYSSNYDQMIATIVWRLYTEGGVETSIATRVTDAMQAESGIAPEPLRFMPTETGVYKLQALINNVVVTEYDIAVIQNTAGIQETKNGLTMKLSGLGRDNNEPSETLTDWSNNGFSTTFNDVQWNNNCGWNNKALVLNNGATAIIDNKPFSEEIAPHLKNGCVFEIDFETFNVDDENAELVRIGGDSGASLVITTNKATLKSSLGANPAVSRFKANERIKIAFVVYPNSGTDYDGHVFVYNNAVMSSVRKYNEGENFNIGRESDSESTFGMIHLGNSEGKAGIKIYYIRTYDMFINMYEELNNYFIDSGENLQSVVTDNDIYSPNSHNIDIDKLKSTITTVELTGPLDTIVGVSSVNKESIVCAMSVSSPGKSSINLNCDKAELKKAGQSTLLKPVPSFHVKLDKNGNVCYDRDGKIYPKNRWAFRSGNVPEKKFRLQANYMDSSGCHNGAFFRMFNEVAPRVVIDGEHVLQTPIQRYIANDYSNDMRRIHGEDPSGNNWTFPYTINIVPDSIPCIVVWRPNENSPYRFLGQYVIMEEKKANYANGMHSIYSMVDSDGNPDPFGFKKDKEGERLWDNGGCHQMEILRSTTDLALFLDKSQWNAINPETGGKVREETFELIYPDEDDLTQEEIEAEWQKFYDDIVNPVVSSRNNQETFKDLLYRNNPKLSRWHLAAYYCLAMRNACTDSMVRNMEFVTYDGSMWLPKWWDVDMQCGLQQTGECNIEPCSDRDTPSPSVASDFVFSGRLTTSNGIVSSWFWDALVGNSYAKLPPMDTFMNDVKKMDAALFNAGWNYTAITTLQDNVYVGAWSKALYNESSVYKYLRYFDYLSLQGDRTPHRHWFLRTSYDYFDALNGCGEYVTRMIAIRVKINTTNRRIMFKAAKTSYFGWALTGVPYQTGIKVEKGDIGYLDITQTTEKNDPLQIYSSNNIEEIDLSDIAEYMVGSDLNFAGIYDTVLGSQLKVLHLGLTKEMMNNGIFNLSTAITNIQRKANVDDAVEYPIFNKLEVCDVQGLQYFTTFDMWDMENLKEFYAAGSNLITFIPREGTNFTKIELPTSIISMSFNSCNLTDDEDNCLIDWYETVYENDVPVRVQKVGIPTTLKSITCVGMGTDEGAKKLVLGWARALNAVPGNFEGTSLTFRNINWTNVDVNDVINLGKISNKTLTGRIQCTGELTGSVINELLEYFDDTVFNPSTGVAFRIDFDSSFFVVSGPSELLAGENTTLNSFSFPMGDSTPVEYTLGRFDSLDNFVPCSSETQTQHGTAYYWKNVIFYPSTKQLITLESNDPDHTIAIKAVKGNVEYILPILIRRRTYPQSVDYDVTYSQGSTVLYYENSDLYHIASDNTVLTLTAHTIPSNVDGTDMTAGSPWNIPQSIRNICSVTENGDTVVITVGNIDTNLVSGVISYTKQYANGVTYSASKTFNFKELAVAVSSEVNAPLQQYLYNNGIANTPGFTYDTEVANITDLSDMFATVSSLTHIVEFNNFPSLNMTTLDLSGCPLLGTAGVIRNESGTNVNTIMFPYVGATPTQDFVTIDLSNTHYAGIELKSGNTLESITYGDYTTIVDLENQTVLEEVNIPTACVNILTKLEIKDCDNLEEITWLST